MKEISWVLLHTERMIIKTGFYLMRAEERKLQKLVPRRGIPDYFVSGYISQAYAWCAYPRLLRIWIHFSSTYCTRSADFYTRLKPHLTLLFCLPQVLVNKTMCRGEDLNLHELLHTVLNRARLPFRHLGKVFQRTAIILTWLSEKELASQCIITPSCLRVGPCSLTDKVPVFGTVDRGSIPFRGTYSHPSFLTESVNPRDSIPWGPYPPNLRGSEPT